MENANKIKLLKVWEILNSDSDECSPISTNELIERLKEQGISCDRRTLYHDINTLNQYGFEITTAQKGRTNYYYVSERSFDTPELRILMDAVTAANFITRKKAKELHRKIAALAGNTRAELLMETQDEANLTKLDNENIYYIVNEIDQAILSGKKISFQYFDYDLSGKKVFRKNGERYLLNPVSTVFSGDRYYLIAFLDKYENLSHYRADRISSVAVEDAKRANPQWLERVNLAEYKSQLFSMFGGETVRAGFLADNSLVDVVFDKFGTRTELMDKGDKTFAFCADVQISPVFFGWCLSFGNKLRIISPKSLVEDMSDYIESVQKCYKNKG